MVDNVHIVEQFFGVYLLFCENPKYLGRTYIGFTVDPNRRIKQHNKGKKFGGAWKTSNKGPWKMILIIHGFPNDIAALRFEWAWQHPQSSRRLEHLQKKKSKEKVFEYCLRILSEMLKVGPWNRLPLTVRWLDQSYAINFPVNKTPPLHMPICYGPVTSKKLANSQNSKTGEHHSVKRENILCYCCKNIIDSDDKLDCLSPNCDMKGHIQCIAELFLEIGEYIPVEGSCPKCGVYVLWGDLIRKSQGCYENLSKYLNENSYETDSDEN